MDLDKLSKQERYDALTEMADMYYNQGKTQSEIADCFETNRFKVAKLLQDARNEQIVEIKINYTNERNKTIEQELMEKFPLNKAVVVNTQFAPYIDGLSQIGQVGAAYLSRLLTPHTVLGITWGKTIQTVISRLVQQAHNPVSAVQLTGYMPLANPASESRELVRTVSASYFSTPYYLNAPHYVKSPELKTSLFSEPDIHTTLSKARELTAVITGIGGSSSLPLINPVFRPYLTQRDIDSIPACSGSIYGCVLDQDGQAADLDLNRKLIAVPLEDILMAAHRIAVVYGRHKADITSKVIKNGYINEVITDTETAVTLLKHS